jgi:hypothetical protein
MSLETAFAISAVVTEAAVVGLLLYRRAWRTLPVFFAYVLCALLSDIVAYAIRFSSPAGYGIGFYFATTALDSALQLCVLVELAWSVLRPLRPRLSRKALFLVAALILAAGAAIWPFVRIPGLALPSTTWRLMFQLQQTVTILRVLFFVLLAGCSQLLSIGWRDRELQVATGFGFYSLVSLAVAAVNTHQTTVLQVGNLYWIVAFSFLFSLFYWVFSFAQKEAERREFTPQMQRVLLTLARSARISRAEAFYS